MLCEHCTIIIFWQKSLLCHNFVTMLADVAWHWENIQATLNKHCTNNVFWPNCNVVTMLSQHWPMSANIETVCMQCLWMLYRCSCPMLYLIVLGPKWQLHSNLNVLHINKNLHWNNYIYNYSWILLPTIEVGLICRWWIFRKFS